MNLRHLWMRAKAAASSGPPPYELEPGDVVWVTTSGYRIRFLADWGWLVVTDRRLLWLPEPWLNFLVFPRAKPLAISLAEIVEIIRERGWRRWWYRDLPWWPVWSIQLRSGERIRFRTPQIPLVHQADAAGRVSVQPFAKVRG